jgi:hypothetical protein
VDETFLKVRGRWAYLYRAIDRDGNLVDTMLSEHRDMAAAQAFFRSAKAATGITPERVTTDGHGSYPRAIRSTLGRRVVPRTSAYKNNGLEQDHRGVKGRTRCMRGFKSFVALSPPTPHPPSPHDSRACNSSGRIGETPCISGHPAWRECSVPDAADKLPCEEPIVGSRPRFRPVFTR